MDKFNKTIAVLVGLFLFSQVQAQSQTQERDENFNNDEGLTMYASFSGGYPVKGLSKYDYSFGAYTHFDYNFNKYFAARFDLGWCDFSGEEREYTDSQGGVHTDTPNMSVWEFTAGARAKISYFYVEARGGYFTGIHDWGYVPAIGVKFWKLDIQANIIMTKDVQWGGARIGYFF